LKGGWQQAVPWGGARRPRNADHPIQIEAVTMFRHPAGSWSLSIDGIWSARPYVGDWVRIRQLVSAAGD